MLQEGRAMNRPTKAAPLPGWAEWRQVQRERSHCRTGRDFRGKSAVGVSVQRAAGGKVSPW